MSIAVSTSVIDAWDHVQPPPPPQIAPVTIDSTRTAFLLLDFLRDVCTAKRPRAEAALPNLLSFLTQARDHKMLVVHTSTRFGADDGSDLADAIRPANGERIFKAPFNKFHGTDLEQHLKSHEIDTLILAGTSPNGCLLFTVGGALLRGFRVIVPIDGMPAATLYQEQFVAWQLVNGPGFGSAVVLSKIELIDFAENPSTAKADQRA
jgi:nicotinamidase-related amidase